MKRLLSLIVFLIVAALGLSLAGQVWLSKDDADRTRFQAVADDATARLTARIQAHLSLLRGAHALFVSLDNDVPPSVLERFVKNLDLTGTYSGVQGIGYAPVVPPGRASVVMRQRPEGGGEVGIWPEATDQPFRTPIGLIEPLDPRNQASLGFDMFSNAARRTAMIEAARSGKVTATARVRLVQEIDEDPQAGFLIYMSLPRDAAAAPPQAAAASPPSAEDSVSGIEGFVFAAFRAGDLFGASLLQSPLLPVSVTAYDSFVDPANLLFRSGEPADPDREDFAVDRRLHVGGREWILKFAPTPAFGSIGSNVPAALLSLAGLLLAAALAMLTQSQARRVRAVAKLHAQTHRSLAEKDLMLSEMKHRIKNSITRVLAMARQTAKGATSVEDFMQSYAARLTAMANAQEMLTRSRWQRADLGDLLGSELVQVFGEKSDVYELSGPEVALSERETQALGLVFHELATNALKYGDFASDEGALEVSWTLEAKQKDRAVLVLDWRESGRCDLVEPGSVGFGTRLIDTNVVGELGGVIERDFRSEGLRIRIQAPLSQAAAADAPGGALAAAE